MAHGLLQWHQQPYAVFFCHHPAHACRPIGGAPGLLLYRCLRSAAMPLPFPLASACCTCPSAVGGRIARNRTDLSGPAAEGEDCCGPLRAWPGGHQMTRAFTQHPAMPVVIPHPHVQQVSAGGAKQLYSQMSVCVHTPPLLCASSGTSAHAQPHTTGSAAQGAGWSSTPCCCRNVCPHASSVHC
jgi:hypothetical protein